MTMVGFLVTLIKAGLVFGLLAITIKGLRRFDRRAGTGGGRRARRSRGAGRPTGRSRRGRRDERVLEIVERAQVGRASSVILVRVQDQHWVLGVTEQQISMLTEVDVPEPVEDAIDLRAEPTTVAPFGLKAWQDLARHARQYLSGGQKVELLDLPDMVDDRPLISADDRPTPTGDADLHGRTAANGRTEANGRTDGASHENHESGS
jgi:hypothetical protein